MKLLPTLILVGAANAAVPKIDPSRAEMVMSSLSVGSGISLPPMIIKWSNMVLKNRMGNMWASLTVNQMSNHRELVTKMSLKMLPKVAVARRETIKPLLDPQNIRARVHYGPIKLPMAQKKTFSTRFTTEKGSRLGLEAVQAACSDCFVYEGKTFLTYADGSEATPETGVFNHHTVMMNLDKTRRMLECTSGPEEPALPSPFLASSEESGDTKFRSYDGKIKSGYYVSPKDRFMLFSEFMNYKDTPQEVYITFEYEYVNGRPKDAYETRLATINVGPCASAGFIPDTDKYSRSGNWTIPVDGYLMQMTGHLHDGGKNMIFQLNGKQICDSVAIYSPVRAGTPAHGHADMDMDAPKDAPGTLKETISDVTRCTDTIPVKKGDILTLQSNYDLTAHGLRRSTTGQVKEVMGVGGIMMAIQPGTDF